MADRKFELTTVLKQISELSDILEIIVPVMKELAPSSKYLALVDIAIMERHGVR